MPSDKWNIGYTLLATDNCPPSKPAQKMSILLDPRTLEVDSKARDVNTDHFIVVRTGGLDKERRHP